MVSEYKVGTVLPVSKKGIFRPVFSINGRSGILQGNRSNRLPWKNSLTEVRFIKIGYSEYRNMDFNVGGYFPKENVTDSTTSKTTLSMAETPSEL